jgi:NAD(P)-dependent dehydrogenase (short-subunit alcohol dehydrogenase family)
MKTAIVTGGSRGIGQAIADRLIQEGYKVITCARSGADVICDVTNLDEIQTFADLISKSHGSIDILINNAGGCADQDYLFGDIPPTEWIRIINQNLNSVAYVTQAFLPLINQGGSIVNISTSLTNTPMPGKSLYSVSKAGLETLTRNLALELGDKKIRVNCVQPGPTDTDLLRTHFYKDNVFNQQGYDAFAKSLLFERLCSPADIDNAVGFLCSNQAEMITGQILGVDGGRSLRW